MCMYTQTDKGHASQLCIQSLKLLVQADSRDKQNPTSDIPHEIRMNQSESDALLPTVIFNIWGSASVRSPSQSEPARGPRGPQREPPFQRRGTAQPRRRRLSPASVEMDAESPCACVLQEAEGTRDWAGRAQSAPAHCPPSLSEPQSLELPGVSVSRGPASPANPVLLGCIPSGDIGGARPAATMPVRTGRSAAGAPTHRGGPARGRGRCHRSARRAGGAGRRGREAWAGKGGGVARLWGSCEHGAGAGGGHTRDSPCRPTARCTPPGPRCLAEKRRAAAGAWWLRAAARVVRMPATPESTLGPRLLRE